MLIRRTNVKPLPSCCLAQAQACDEHNYTQQRNNGSECVEESVSKSPCFVWRCESMNVDWKWACTTERDLNKYIYFFVCVWPEDSIVVLSVAEYSYIGVTHVSLQGAVESTKACGQSMACYKSEVLSSKFKVAAHKGKDQISVSPVWTNF